MIVILLQSRINIETSLNMKKSFIRTVVLAVMLCALTVFTSCGNKSTENAETAAPTSEQFEPDARFASIDTLVDVMTKSMSVHSTEELVAHFDTQAAAMKSYWYLNHKGGDESRIDEDVCNDLKVLADSLSGGSTVDMEQSNEITCAIARYLTAKEYCNNHIENSLYQAEMQDWLLLEDELQAFYTDLAQLANWGGTISRVTGSGALSFLAQVRQEDYSKLKKGSSFADEQDMTIEEARTNLIQELEDAKSLEDDMGAGDDFNKTLESMRLHADKVVESLDKWLASRVQLCEAEGIPTKHNAHLVAKLGQRIMELIEG